jgi:hypothetical protein
MRAGRAPRVAASNGDGIVTEKKKPRNLLGYGAFSLNWCPEEVYHFEQNQ